MLGRFGSQGWWPADDRFEMMIGAILTQNAAWINVEKAIANLKQAGVLSPHGLNRLPIRRLAALIRPSGYFNIKARRVKSFVRFLCRSYRGSVNALCAVPQAELRARLLGVSGIGPETADSILLYAAGHPAFVVDAYTRRIFSRHGWVSSDVSYDELQGVFTSTLPADAPYYNEYHALLVRVGKDYCRRRPLCDACPVARVLGEPVSMQV